MEVRTAFRKVSYDSIKPFVVPIWVKYDIVAIAKLVLIQFLLLAYVY